MACRITVDSIEVRAGNKILVRTARLEWGPGGLHFIIGPNGAGKTTLLRAILGASQYRGRVLLCGETPGKARRHVSYVPAAIGVDPWARVSEVEKAMMYGTVHADKGWLQGLLERAGLGWLSKLRERRFGELSSGEQRLVLIAAAIRRGPKILIADEPLSFLDISNQVRVLTLLSLLAGDVTVLMTTHEIAYIGYADTVTIISRGEVVYSGPPSRVDPKVLEDVYGVKVDVVYVGDVRTFLPRMAQVVREHFTAPSSGAHGSTQRSS